MTFSDDELLAHLEALAEALDVELEYVPVEKGSWYQWDKRRILVERHESAERTSAAGLHELGHVALRHERHEETPDGFTSEQEVEAWEWARSHSLIPFRGRDVLSSLLSYAPSEKWMNAIVAELIAVLREGGGDITTPPTHAEHGTCPVTFERPFISTEESANDRIP